MKHMRLFIAALVCLAGCGSTGIYVPSRVSDSVRAACISKTSIMFDEQTVNGLLDYVEAAMQEGYSRNQVFKEIEGECIRVLGEFCAEMNGGDCPPEQSVDLINYCDGCILAIIDQVYGN